MVYICSLLFAYHFIAMLHYQRASHGKWGLFKIAKLIKTSGTDPLTYLVGGLVAIFYVPKKNWECHHPNWPNPIFQKAQAPTRYTPIKIWLVVWNIFYFPIYWECHHPNWRSYFSEGWLNHQPEITGGPLPLGNVGDIFLFFVELRCERTM